MKDLTNINNWPDDIRLKMISKSEFYENAEVYQFGFYDGFQSKIAEMYELLKQMRKIFLTLSSPLPASQAECKRIDEDITKALEAYNKLFDNEK